MSIKIAFIGAGSVGFTRRLFRDVLTVPELRDTTFAFIDISKRNLEMVTRLCEKDLRNNPDTDGGVQIISTTNRRRGLEGANYVINCARIGGLEAFRHDIEIPLKYGVDQCVGDTLCMGGLMYAQRSIPALLAFCGDIRRVAARDCLLMNYANPMAMNTWAALAEGGVRTIGLCHGVYNTARMLAGLLGVKDARELDVLAAGINHQTWFLRIAHKGRVVTTARLLRALERHPEISKSQKVRIDVLRRFGYFSTESNGHLSEYLPWYRKRPKEIRKWIGLEAWNQGETAGYLRHCTERRNWFETDFPRWLDADDPPITAANRSHEHGSYIIEALETGRTYRGHFNVRNEGLIDNLPSDCVVEVPCYVDRNGIAPVKVGPLPLACAATLSASINVQRMGVRAAVTGDATLLKQAALHDPLTAAVCDPPEIWQMVDEMLLAQAEWLGQYRREIPKARKRLAEAAPLGRRKWAGAARKKIKTVEQLRKTGDMSDITKVAAKSAED